MTWKIEYIKEAQRDLLKLDPYNRRIILKAIEKTAERPLSPPDGIGKPLGHHASSNLTGYYKIKLRDLGEADDLAQGSAEILAGSRKKGETVVISPLLSLLYTCILFRTFILFH